MTPTQYEKFVKMITHDASVQYDKLMDDEIEAQPENVKFLTGVKASPFFKSLFINGYARGVHWMHNNKDTKFVLGE